MKRFVFIGVLLALFIFLLSSEGTNAQFYKSSTRQVVRQSMSKAQSPTTALKLFSGNLTKAIINCGSLKRSETLCELLTKPLESV
jgi:outer membrane lipoprotein-sorting protein